MKPADWQLPDYDWSQIDAMAGGSAVRADSRLVLPGDVFLACRGEHGDSRLHIADAIQRGARAVLWEQENFTWDASWNVPNLGLPQLRDGAGVVAAHLYGDPSQSMTVVGVTGTNGKTSTASWLAQCFNRQGGKAAFIGTTGYGFLDALTDASHTTPDPVRLQGLLAEYRKAGASHVAMEVSSHGLDQARAHGVAFDVAVFTNLTHDHLDYHGNFDAYADAKAKLFRWEGLKAAVVNLDDPFGAQMLAGSTAATKLGYGFNQGEIRARAYDCCDEGIRLTVDTPWGSASLDTHLIGRFNAYNLMGCLGALLASGISLEDAAAALSQVESAKGRMQRLGGWDQPMVVVDYSHTPDSLEKALSTLREILPVGGRLICVFGCGGDRDRTKRPLMGRIACRWADMVIITNDNPRSEEPKRIIDDIIAGVSGVDSSAEQTVNYSIDSDRGMAIHHAVQIAHPGDIVLIAGKGHEEYQEIKGVKTHFSDIETARHALAHKREGK
ncbi:UDP-N-acetylmuramoyl-L-alanyl-D-glutamate--2,6-diaminopimelate ligase [Parachitinimonas caeni]|uniref:UDP-N-acetylmuramoyl-L-alanyl-D-glutamate--2,6-diaminopimelate ligase n=1 Tax=Parachitinimonas caeni TaxID=3031301 RepID=A0ABT7DQW2_9NEIS|nr:UDP-N-acetylmuramoyl-L-alanyl-D-glutamate--2,6-diaminopimelate ligase [Parachitinimonas caeni]MDK2122458.1 UDP-N-acetylmuramoyl-L-alanyl-D-glutamate--2,6-diaminopimelate ligase [Parachitinimonas caeni]